LHRFDDRNPHVLGWIAALIFLAPPAAWPQQKQPDLADQSLEDLMAIQVTSVSRTEERLSRTASAIFVITQEDIRRSNALNIPDLLRMVPGVDVAQINANTWAISARGFNGEFSNELLVMVDGRTVYIPTFGGVDWDVLDIPLEDISRIEVIRGPGGAVWGANAVNGVINIITKNATETHGAMIVTGGGNLDQGFGTIQYGGEAGKSTSYRVYAKYQNIYHLPDANAHDGDDGWNMLRGGFRTDSVLTPKDKLTVQGDIYTGSQGSPTSYLPSITSPGWININTEVPLSGGFAQSIWQHTFSSRSDTTLQISYDRYTREDVLHEKRGTLNLDFQHHLAWGTRQNFVWGFDYRYSSSKTHGDLTTSLNPADLNTNLFGAFIEDEIALVRDRLYLKVGTKFEHNNFSGFNAMPTARLSWNPSVRDAFWVGISRSVETPHSTVDGLRLNFGGFTEPNGTQVLISFLGNPRFQDEDLLAYEAGYRANVSSKLSLDFAAYFNQYSKQQTTEPSTPFFETTPAPPHLVLPTTFENLMHGETHGLEISANWKVIHRWTLSPGYAFEEIHMHTSRSSVDTQTVPQTEGSNPPHSAQLRSRVELEKALVWDSSVFFVDRLLDPKIPSYTRLDSGITWHWTERMSFGVAGQNLLKDSHLEFIDPTGVTRSTLIKRGAYAKLSWRF